MRYVPAQSRAGNTQRQSTNEGLGCDVEQQRRNPSGAITPESAQRACCPVNLPFQILLEMLTTKSCILVQSSHNVARRKMLHSLM